MPAAARGIEGLRPGNIGVAPVWRQTPECRDLTSVRVARRITHRRFSLAPRRQRVQVSITLSGWSFEMSFRLLATERRTYSLSSSRRFSINASTGAGSRTNTGKRSAHGRRGRVPSETSRRTCSSGSLVQTASVLLVSSECDFKKGRIASSEVNRGVSSRSASSDLSGWPRP